MSREPLPSEPTKVERRREILYGSPGVTIYRNGRPVLWMPDDFSTLTRKLPAKELEALQREIKQYLGLDSPAKEKGNKN